MIFCICILRKGYGVSVLSIILYNIWIQTPTNTEHQYRINKFGVPKRNKKKTHLALSEAYI